MIGAFRDTIGRHVKPASDLFFRDDRVAEGVEEASGHSSARLPRADDGNALLIQVRVQLLDLLLGDLNLLEACLDLGEG